MSRRLSDFIFESEAGGYVHGKYSVMNACKKYQPKIVHYLVILDHVLGVSAWYFFIGNDARKQ